jgi:hypothetical protein
MLLSILLVVVLLLLLWVLYVRWKLTRFEKGKKRVLFFHPYSHAMGGGERVLFSWISALPVDCLSGKDEALEIAIATGDSSEGFQEIEVTAIIIKYNSKSLVRDAL